MQAGTARPDDTVLRGPVLSAAHARGDLFVAVNGDWVITLVGEYTGRTGALRPGEPLGTFVDAAHEAAQWALYRRCMDERRSLRFLEHAPEQDRWTEVRVHPAEDGGLSLFFLDVTDELRRALGRRGTGSDEPAELERESHLIGIVSHDLRSPLQAIRLHAALALKALSPPSPLGRHLEGILGSSERAARMIDDLLDLTRLRVGGMLELTPGPVQLWDLVAQIADEVLASWPGRKVELVTSGDGAGTWDADRLGQVVQNLIGNALQHSTEEHTVSVRGHGDADQVRLDVHNAGPAIAREQLPTLFDAFRRGRRASGRRSVGLGLYIAERIVRAHDGTIEVHSSDASGTTFSVLLPRHCPPPPSDSQP